ncbi:MAG: hypothetical protein ACHQM6_06360 [Candidatus Kapaibacterium sp.]
MLSNDYTKLIEPLRNREVQPSFEEIRSLVLHQKRSRRFLPIPFWLYLSASAPLLVALSILLFPELFGLQRTDRQLSIGNRLSSFAGVDEGRESVKEKTQFSVSSNLKPFEQNRTLKTNDDRRTTTDDPRPTIDHRPSTIDKPGPTNIESAHGEKIQQKDSSPSKKAEAMKAPESAAAPIHSATETSGNPVADRRLSLFISGGLPASQSAIPVTDRLFGSVGIRYALSPASSAIVELRRNSFIQKADAKKISFHDTVLTVGNQSYHSTIGELSSFPVESANDVFSIGAGYRFTFMESGSFLPFAEIILGAATQGGLTSELAGVRYSLDFPFSFELALRSDQFFSRGAPALTAFSLNAALNFSW